MNEDQQPVSLIDLKNDPTEEKNLIGSNDKEAQKALRFLSKQLAKFPDRDNDPIYDPLPPQPWDVEVTAESEVWKR